MSWDTEAAMSPSLFLQTELSRSPVEFTVST